jgi:glutamate N-acetyltransferase/amino-acid N-acetyltransferase
LSDQEYIWPIGFRAAGISAGIKSTGAPDLAMLRMDGGAVAAAMFTTNLFAAAPVQISRDHLHNSRGHANVLIVNSGGANAATGPHGYADAQLIGDYVAQECGCAPDAVLMNSTGIIGKRLPLSNIQQAITPLASSCVTGSAEPFARAIMTTDTRIKMSTRLVGATGSDDSATANSKNVKNALNQPQIRVTGVAKGAGMIHPNMATMIAVITTDAALEPNELDAMLRVAVEQSFHRISIDGDTSTNDSVFAFATAQRGAAADHKELQRAFCEVARELAHMIVCDGEGFTRAFEVRVRGAASAADALAVSKTMATSMLVRCAITGGDPNWGRLLAAAGRSGAKVDPEQVSLCVGDVVLFQHGQPADTPKQIAAAEFSKANVIIELDLGLGAHEDFFISSGLTQEYVKLNSEYST